MSKSCSECRHWRPRPAGHKGDCLLSRHESSTYKLVGSLDYADIYEETKPDYWCVLFEEIE